jgi:glycerophosphoryl diester phosphodiesterase
VTRWVLVSVALVAVAALMGPPASAERPVSVAAHRGGALLWPENSRLAFESAVKLGADFLELDVHLSRDGEVIVIHDPTLERTTTGTGPVREHTAAELRALHLKDQAGAVTREVVPTLDEVVQVAARGRRQLLLEIKVDDRRQRYPEIEEKTLAVLDRHAMGPSTIVMAFEAETWRRMRELRPGQRAGALYSGRTLAALASDAPREMEAAHKAGVAFVGLQHALVTPATVALARRLGLTLGAWTVNDAPGIERVIQLGAGVVISDRPDLAIGASGRKTQ